MTKIFSAVCAVVLGVLPCIALTSSSQADVVVNNVFSPGSVTVIGPGGQYLGPDYYGGYGYDNYTYRPRYHRSESYEPRYYEQRYYEPRYQRSGYYGRRGPYCWVTTDKDRNYGYWDWCR